MTDSKRIDLSLLSDDLKTLINAGAKIFPSTIDVVNSNTNPNGYEFIKVQHDVYTWDVNKWVLIGADDKNVAWSELTGIPISFLPTPHTHTEVDITGLDKYTQAEINTKLSAKSDVGHTHTEYALVTHNHSEYALVGHSHSEYALTGHTHSTYALLAHDHDGRYYLKSEVDGKLLSKSDTTHTHTELHTHSNKTLLDSIVSGNVHTHSNKGTIDQLTQSHIDALNNGLSSGHTHGNLSVLDKITYTGTQPTVDLIGIEQASGHVADGTIHVTATDKTNWNAKSNFSGSFTDLTNKPTIPTATSQLTNDSGFVTNISGKADKTYVDTELAKKTDSSTFNGHTGNSTIHVTQTDKDTWNTNEITIGATQPTSNLWYKVVG